METKKRLSEKKRFSIIARLKSTTHAWRGLGIVVRTTHNFWVHIFFAILAVLLGFILNISSTEWEVIVLVIGFVIAMETMNTAFEVDIDLTSPEEHPSARNTKDIAAGAVLISAIVAGIVGLIIFLPKIIALM